MDPRTQNQVKLAILGSEPLARLTEQRLRQENIPCVVRSLGVGPGGWGPAANIPHAIYVRASDEMNAREVLELIPAELSEKDDSPPQVPKAKCDLRLNTHRNRYLDFKLVLAFLLILGAILILGSRVYS